ncbi:MAG: dienelactone hydrolase family protein [Chthoniobacterales bacterium]
MKHTSFLALLACTVFSSAQAKLVTQTVAYEHNGTPLTGYLAYDDAKVSPGKTPGILLIHEWWGLNDYAKSRANQLAELGYVTFAADMYGQGVTTEDPKKAGELAGQFYGKPLMAERAQAGLDQLKKNPSVDPAKLAAIGFCFGGSTVQALAYSGAPLVGIVSFHGGPVPAPAEVAGKVKTHFLLLNGAIDPMVPAPAKADLEKSLEAARIDYQSIDFAGALHAFTNPAADQLATSAGLTGKIGYNATAAERSWKQMQIFFDEILK